MAKQKQTSKQKQKSRQRSIDYKGVTYTFISRDGKITVKAKRTARGQKQIAGVFDLVERTWQSGKKNTPLPRFVQAKVETLF